MCDSIFEITPLQGGECCDGNTLRRSLAWPPSEYCHTVMESLPDLAGNTVRDASRMDKACYCGHEGHWQALHRSPATGAHWAASSRPSPATCALPGLLGIRWSHGMLTLKRDQDRHASSVGHD